MATRSPTTRGTGFINPQDYLRANAGAAGGMQDALSAWLGSRAGRVQQGLSGIEGDFDRDVQLGSLEFAPEGISEEEARKAAGTQYTGPQSLSESDQWASLMGKAGKASQAASQGADYYGRQALLKETYGKQGGYTPGMARFDSFLTGGNGGQSRFESLKKDFGGLTGTLKAADKASQGKAGVAQQNTARAAEEYGKYADSLAAGRTQAQKETWKQEGQALDQEMDEHRQGQRETFGKGKQRKPSWP